MKIRLLLFVALSVCGAFVQSCNDPSSSGVPRRTTQPTTIFPGVHFGIGNRYHWRYTRISYGTVNQWAQTVSIIGDTTLSGARYFVFSTGEILRSSGDTVFAYTQGSASVYYRLNVEIGQSVPFRGYLTTVTAVDTETVFGETHRIVTVSNQSSSPDTIITASYASKFGPLVVDKRDAFQDTWGSLAGARVDTVNYGFIQKVSTDQRDARKSPKHPHGP